VYPAAQGDGAAHHVSPRTIISRQPVPLRAWQEQHGWFGQVHIGLPQHVQRDGPALDQVKVSLEHIVLEIVQAAEVAAVEHTCPQGNA